MSQDWLRELPFHQNEILFGHDSTPGLVAIEVAGPDSVSVFHRRGEKTESERVAFRPFILLEARNLLKGWKGDAEIIPLEGKAGFNFLAFFPNLKKLEEAKFFLQKKTGKVPSAMDAPYRYFSDPIHQFLLLFGTTHFLGMGFEELKRMQLDIETYCQSGFEFPNPQRDSDRITAIAMSDSTGWERVITGKEYDEHDMLVEMVREIQDRDPDIIEGHNLFRFDLEYIESRARKTGVPLKIGRDGSLLEGHASRMQIAERSITYRKYQIFGRHIIDTWMLAQHYDVATRSLKGYGLKEIARHFDIAGPDRTYIPAERASWYFDHEPETLFRYALDDVRETRGLSEILSPSYFIQAQIFPYPYQDVPLRGNATKIDSLFLREYLYCRRAIPRPSEGGEVVGGYTDVGVQGVAKNVLHCDVTSLYPSIMIAYGYFPKKDTLGIFPGLVRDLRDFRVKAKELAREAEAKEARIYFSALQATFKILINSFYGYLGFGLGHFNDFEVANQVTAKGRELIQAAVSWLQQKGATVLEIDTDGIYFVPPKEVVTEQDEDRMIEELGASLPEGIDLELDGRYQSMFSYKMKNYALLNSDGKLVVKGSGLRSRGLELFQRQWMEEMLLLLLRGEKEKIPALYQRYLDDLEHHRMDISLLMKTETLQESLESYQNKVQARKRNAAAPYELAIKSERRYQPGDQISYYVTGNKAKVKISDNCKLVSQWDADRPDENVDHYKAKLKELYEKFRPYIEGDR